MGKLKEKVLSIFGDIKLIPWPLFIYYQKGDYYKISGEDTRKLADAIRPGDIIIRGYDSYLDGYFIPGEYSHSGIYVGDGNIIHAIAEGVRETTLIDFCRCDRIIVMRPPEHKKTAIERARIWLGKPYDFDFEVGDSAFYCHELTARAYQEFDIPKVTPYLGFIKFKKSDKKYLAESFINYEGFKKVIEINYRRNK
jgi:hypothetical protein